MHKKKNGILYIDARHVGIHVTVRTSVHHPTCKPMSNVTNQHNKVWKKPEDMENDNSLSVIYAIHMKMNDRS